MKNLTKKENISVILPGSYDPVTLGHLDIIKRASEKYSEVYAVIFQNPEKSYRFTLDERVKMLMLATDEIDNCMVSYSNGLVIDYMREHGIEKIVKGFRNEKDYEYELKQAEWNKKHGGYDTELLAAKEALGEVSSTEAKRRIECGEDASDILHPDVLKFIRSHRAT